MSPTLDWFAAPFEPHGSTSGDGARRLLGQPSLDPLTVLVRETLQNSWDARDDQSAAPPAYRVHLRTLEPNERETLLKDVFGDSTARADKAGLGLSKILARPKLRVIEIADWGTKGLAGPIRADLAPDPDEPTNFVDFIFNIGAVRDTHLGGGTYGFGKTISFVVSRASTMVVSSCVDSAHGLQSRLIASAIGSEFTSGGRRFTGRQWWGWIEDRRIGPAVGEPARELASRLGLSTDRPGTSLLILDPDLRGRSERDAMQFLTSSLLWHAWPKMVPHPGSDGPPVDISAMLNGSDFPIPDPREEPRLAPFVAALQRVRAAQSGCTYRSDDPLPNRITLLKCGRPRKDLGHLGLIFSSAAGISPSASGIAEDQDEERPPVDACPFKGHSHHTALMRQAELIVTYEEGPPSSVDGFQWGGVFRSLKDVDDHFAMAEPPAHEGWDPEFVSNQYGRTFVRVALRDIRKGARSFAAPPSTDTDGDSATSTASVGDVLAAIIPSLDGTAPTSRIKDKQKRTRRRRNRQVIGVEIVGVKLASVDGGRGVTLRLLLEARDRPTVIEVAVGVRTDTGREVSPPEGTVPPSLGSLTSPDGQAHEPGAGGRYEIPEGPQEEWTLTISHHDIAALDVAIDAYVRSSKEE